VRAYVVKGGNVAYLEPSYSLIPPLLRINEVIGDPHPFADGYTLPDSFLASRAPLKFITNPNSPTGTLLPLDAVVAACRASRGVVVLDEAYVDFAPASGLAVLSELPNLLLARTMSKSYSLAGLRLGFAIGSTELIDDLRAVKDPSNVSRPAQVAGIAAFEDQAHWRRCVDEVLANRQRLTDELRARRWDVLPSAANFVFAVPSRPAAEVFTELHSRRVLVRHFDGPGLSQGLRISIGTWPECQALLDALDT
jgi:histidinol-phosphate aminotransferase